MGHVNQTSILCSKSTRVQSCRLYAPAYTTSPIFESRYLSLNKTKKIFYKDIFQYSLRIYKSEKVYGLIFKKKQICH